MGGFNGSSWGWVVKSKEEICVNLSARPQRPPSFLPSGFKEICVVTIWSQNESSSLILEKNMDQWAACMMSLVISNLACIVLCSYFSSIVPSKRNLLNRVSIKPQKKHWNKFFLQSQCSNVCSDCLHELIRSQIGRICMTYPHNEVIRFPAITDI